MSRHRFVRSININEELDDDALSDGGEEDLPPAQQEQFDIAVAAARSIIGPEESSSISDAQIKDAVWEHYFEVDKSVQWLLEEQAKRSAVQERKDTLSLHTSSVPSQPPLSALQMLSLAHKQTISAAKPSLSALASRSSRSMSNISKSKLSSLAADASQVAKKQAISSEATPTSAISKLGNPTPSKLSLMAKTKSPQSSTFMPSKPPSVAPSKLAMKIQKAREPPVSLQIPLQTMDQPSLDFLSLLTTVPSRAQASPSSFALLLKPQISSNNNQENFPPIFNRQAPFCFDVPSPDDIVLRARRGTSLASGSCRT